MSSRITYTPGGASDNCYTTLALADAYFADDLREEDWSASEDDRRERALISATRVIEGLGGDRRTADSPARALFPGEPYVDTQALHFPIGDGSDPLAVPANVQEAVCEQALWMMQQKDAPPLLDHAGNQQAGIGSLSLDGISVNYKGGGVPPGVAPEAWKRMESYVQTTWGTA
jgi:hypothetical protein